MFIPDGSWELCCGFGWELVCGLGWEPACGLDCVLSCSDEWACDGINWVDGCGSWFVAALSGFVDCGCGFGCGFGTGFGLCFVWKMDELNAFEETDGRFQRKKMYDTYRSLVTTPWLDHITERQDKNMKTVQSAAGAVKPEILLTFWSPLLTRSVLGSVPSMEGSGYSWKSDSDQIREQKWSYFIRSLVTSSRLDGRSSSRLGGRSSSVGNCSESDRGNSYNRMKITAWLI